MRVFVAGATGAVGAGLLPLLVDAGHTVVGMTRSQEKASTIERAGAIAAVADGLDRAAVLAAVRAATPEVVVHQMTALRDVTDLRRLDRAFAQSNRLRTEGLDHLLAAAREAGARRVVVQSFCGWPYAATGPYVKTEQDALETDPPRQIRHTLDAIRYVERVVPACGMEGVVLRYGLFYGPDTGILTASTIEAIRRSRFPLVGDGNGWWSFLHTADAVAATEIAVERGAPGVYNIVDDEPAPAREWLPALARMVGAEPPKRVPKWIAKILAGEHVVRMMTEGRAGSNAKAKGELGWRPTHESWRQGFEDALAQMGLRTR